MKSKRWKEKLLAYEEKELKQKFLEEQKSAILSKKSKTDKLALAKFTVETARLKFNAAKKALLNVKNLQKGTNKTKLLQAKNNYAKRKADLIFATSHLKSLQQQNDELLQLQKSNLLSAANTIFKSANEIKMTEAVGFSPKLFGRSQHERMRAEKEILAMFSQAESSVTIRNIFVTQHNAELKEGDPKGEFDLDKIIGGPDVKAATNESDDDLIERIYLHISQMLQITNKIHFENNFEQVNPDGSFLLRPDKQNDITRLSFNEFTFYPYKERGPLNIASFNKLLNKITALAKTHHQNIHMLLGTFPVKDKHNNVFNIAPYVQCGEHPRITSITKTISHKEDPLYKNTRLPFSTGGSEGDTILDILDKESSKLFQLLDVNYEGLTAQDIDRFNQLCFYNKDYPPPRILTYLLEQLKNIIIHGKLDDNLAAFFSRNILFAVQNYKKEIDDKFDDFIGDVDEKLSNPTPKQVNPVVPGVNTEFNRIIECTTASGAKFTTGVDVCLDHSYFVAKSALQMKISEALKEGKGFLTSSVSHFITSNSIPAIPEGRMSNVIEQVDPYKSGIHVFKMIQKEDKPKHLFVKKIFKNTTAFFNTHFGGLTHIIEAKPIILNSLPGELKIFVDLNNELMKEYMLLDTLRYRNPKMIAAYDQFIYIHLLNFCAEVVRDEREETDLPTEKLLKDLDSLLTTLNADKKPTQDDLNAIIEQLSAINTAPRVYGPIADLVKSLLLTEMGKRGQVNSFNI